MSAAAARRRKQKLAKQKQQEEVSSGIGTDNTNDEDPVTLRLKSLLAVDKADEATAYEALQLAQSQVRRAVKDNKLEEACNIAYETSLTLLDRHNRVSVASQLLSELIKALNETRTRCTDIWIERMGCIDTSYRTALDIQSNASEIDVLERNRLGRLHLKFLRNAVRWSEALGDIRFGHCTLHELHGMQCWRMSEVSSHDDDDDDDDEDDGGNDGVVGVDDDDDDDGKKAKMKLQCEAVTHLALAEKPDVLVDIFKKLPPPTEEEMRMGHTCPPALRDALLTRSVLVFVAIENLRDANTLVRTYLNDIETRESEKLRISYMNKTDGKAPSHIIFCCMLLRICEMESKTGPLFSWLLRNFGNELVKMYKPEIVKAYTTKIGRIYFDIQPPPSMLSTLENMMGMMGGLGGGAGGGAGGAPGMNPAMMQAMMQSMQGGM